VHFLANPSVGAEGSNQQHHRVAGRVFSSKYELGFLLNLFQEHLVKQGGSRGGFDPGFYITGFKIKPPKKRISLITVES
jgi:hypothetical protein